MLRILKRVSLIFLLALLVRVLNAVLLDFVINPDGIEYAKLARKLADGNFYDFLDPYWSPIYPLFIGFFALFTDSLVMPGIITTMLFSCFLPVMIFLLVKQHYGEKEGYLAALITVFYQYLIEQSTNFVPESVYIILLVSILIIGWQALQEKKIWKYFIIGLLLGLCYLTRPESVIFIFWFAGLIFIGVAQKTIFRQKLKFILLIIVGFIIPAFPYLLYLREATGIWTISGKFNAHFVGGNIYEPKPAVSQTNFVLMLIKTFIFNLEKEHTSFQYLYPPLLMIISGIGLFRSKWDSERFQKEFYFISFFITTVICYALTVVEVRYLVITLPVLFAWLAKGFFEIQDWLVETFEHINFKFSSVCKNDILFSLFSISLVFIYLLPTATVIQSEEKFWEYHKVEMKKAGLVIESHTDKEPLILSKNKITAFYAKGVHIEIVDTRDLLEEINQAKAEYLVLFERYSKNPQDHQDEVEKISRSDKFILVNQNREKIGNGFDIFKIKKDE